jgi:transposase, IS30 family
MGRVRRMLTAQDREEITRGIAEGLSGNEIAVRIDRHPGVVSREIARGGGRGFYRAWRAQRAALKARARPKPTKLATCDGLRAQVVALLRKRYSPDQIAGRLKVDYPEDEGMRVSHEAIYTWIYALPVGELGRLGVRLRSGRARRRPRTGRAPKPRTSPTSGGSTSDPPRPKAGRSPATGKAT